MDQEHSPEKERQMELESLRSLLVLWSQLVEEVTDYGTPETIGRMENIAQEVEEELKRMQVSKREIEADPDLAELMGEYKAYNEGQE